MTNGGKTTLTNSLLRVLPNCCVIHQDDFFKVATLARGLGGGAGVGGSWPRPPCPLLPTAHMGWTQASPRLPWARRARDGHSHLLSTWHSLTWHGLTGHLFPAELMGTLQFPEGVCHQARATVAFPALSPSATPLSLLQNVL